jgi:hypothetical protein
MARKNETNSLAGKKKFSLNFRLRFTRLYLLFFFLCSKVWWKRNCVDRKKSGFSTDLSLNEHIRPRPQAQAITFLLPLYAPSFHSSKLNAEHHYLDVFGCFISKYGIMRREQTFVAGLCEPNEKALKKHS